MAFGGESAESYYDEGLTASMRGDLPQAIAHFEKAIHLDNTFAGAYHQLGKVYFRLGQTDNAVQLLKQVVGAKPKLMPPKLDLAYALIEQGQTEAARQLFIEVIAIKPGNTRATLGMSLCAYHEGQYGVAIQGVQELVTLGGANFAAYYLLARAAKAGGNTLTMEEAIIEASKFLDNSIDAAPDAPEGYYLRGELCRMKEEIPNALDAYRAAEDRSEDQRFYTSYGEHFTKADILVRRGECLEYLGQKESAREMGEKAIKLDPNHKIGKRLAAL